MMTDTPLWDWIPRGTKIDSDVGTFYEFQAPFTELGEPYGEFFRAFFEAWKKDLIPVPVSSHPKSPFEGIYIEKSHYIYYLPIFDDTLEFGFDIDLQGNVNGFAISSHHYRPVSQLNAFLTRLGELMPEIHSLSITNDYFEKIPPYWRNFTHLEYLYLDSPFFTQIPTDISQNWDTLHTLHIKRAPFEIFPSELCTFPNLTDLVLEGCPNLRTLPPEIGQLRNLKRILLIKCPQFTHLPPEIGQLTTLWGIDLVDLAQFTILPSEIGQLIDLRGIKLFYLPKFREISTEIGHCTQLRALRLEHLPLLRELPSTLGQCGLLETLTIDGSVFLDSLPASLAHIATLYTTYNYFHDKVIVPPELGYKIRAIDQRFVLSHDPIESLDLWIEKRGELGLDVASARAFKTWFIDNIPLRAYPWFGGLDGHQPTSYAQIQWLLTHPHPFSADDLDMIDQQVVEWADHDRVDTRTQADWEQFKQKKSKSTKRIK